MKAMNLFTKSFKCIFNKKNLENENNVKKSRGKFEFSNSKEQKGVKGPPCSTSIIVTGILLEIVLIKV